MNRRINRMLKIEQKSYTFELAKESDIVALLQLESDCWPSYLQSTSAAILKRIKQYPEGQIAVKMQGQVVGVIYCQRIKKEALIAKTPFELISTLHVPQGKIIQLLAINISPSVQDRGWGSELLCYVLEQAKLKGGVQKIVAVTRCLHYKNDPNLSLADYIENHKTGKKLDPILNFHTSHGAKIVDIVSNYRPEDTDNLGAGVLIEYDIQKNPKRGLVVPSESLGDEKQNFDDIVEMLFACMAEVIPDQAFNDNLPLRELGFDSLALLELKTLIEKRFKITLHPSFFFEYSMPAAIAEYLLQPSAVASVKSHTEPSKESLEPIAIIGMSCRFPGGVRNIHDYWRLLERGDDAITATPPARWLKEDYAAFPINQGGYLDDIDKFDAGFFNIAPREAELIDPQQRLLLELSWEAIEEAGICADHLRGKKAGVFMGVFSHDYETLLNKNKSAESLDAYYGTGNSPSVAAGRISYVLGLEGPAMAVNTACSSSLVALHLACQSIRQGESELALVGGVNLILTPELSISFSKAGMLSKDGRCKTFDASADGYVRSEGCAVLVLKRLSQALKDGDNVLAVLPRTAVNQDGASNGLTAPNKSAQIKLLKSVFEGTNLSPDKVTYFETHGTGTSLGDPIEVSAIAQVYGQNHRQHPLYLGSVKSNIGHTESVAGLAGLIKVVLALNHGLIPANIHLSHLNPHISLNEFNGQIPTQNIPWSGPRVAVVSSFGFSGTNAHALIEEGPTQVLSTLQHKSHYLICLSAKDPATLKQKVEDLRRHLEEHSDLQIEAIAYTLNVGRCHFSNRLAVIVSSVQELQAKLKQIQETQNYNGYFKGTDVEKNSESLEALADKYVKGQDLDWSLLHEGESHQKIRLPTYPFLKERYWLSDDSKPSARLHPLLFVNTSTLHEQSFKTVLTGEEFYLRDHVVAGEKVLPGVAYLEMARAAGEFALPGKKVKGIEEIVWLNPVVVDAPRELNVRLEPEGEKVRFTVYSGLEKEAVHSRGVLLYQASPLNLETAVQGGKVVQDLESESFSTGGDHSQKVKAPPIENDYSSRDCVNLPPSTAVFRLKAWAPIKSLYERLPEMLHKEAIYQICERQGLSYGKTFQALQWIRTDGKEALGYYQGAVEAGYYLAPNLFDAALHVGVALKQREELELPFALELLTIQDGIPAEGYVHVKIDNDAISLQVLNTHGDVCVEFKDLIFRARERKATDYYLPFWQQEPLESAPNVPDKQSILTEKVLQFVTEGIGQAFRTALKLAAYKIDTKKPYAQYGADSLISVEIISLINKTFEINLRTTTLFDYATINDLAKYIAANYQESIEKIVNKTSNFNTPELKNKNLLQVKSNKRFLDSKIDGSYDRSIDQRSNISLHKILIEKPGAVEEVKFVPTQNVVPKGKEVHILVKASSLNFGDLLCVKGLYPTMPDYPFTPGFEVSGKIIAIGPEVRKFKIGDDVVGLTGPELGGHSALLTTLESLVVKKPHNSTHAEACSFPAVFLTMHHAFEKAKLKRGEKILIQTAAGGTGLIAVQMAQLLGAEIYATAGSEEKLEYLKSLGVRHLINYREEDFEKKVLDLTNSYGVDVVINTLSGDAIQKGLNLLAPNGRYLEIAMTGLKTSQPLDLSRFNDNQTFYSIDLRKLMKDTSLLEDYLSVMAKTLAEGKIRPTISKIFDFSQIKDAYTYLENRKNIGKIVVEFPEVAISIHGEINNSFEHDIQDIAIVGMSGQFPGAKNLEEFWSNLATGKSMITEVPGNRWDQNETSCRWGAFLEGIEHFDPLFFDIPPVEAVQMDPQQRLFLMEAWHALEDAGYANNAISNVRCSVFVGASVSDYHKKLQKQNSERVAQEFWGNNAAVIASRISYFLNLKGAAVTVDTACSSSLVALHLGCQSLIMNESDMVIVGGTFIMCTPDFYHLATRAGMLSTDGKCHTFDDSANGFVPGEAVAAVILKPLKKAKQDGDRIYAVIKGSHINQDGKTYGITAPSAVAQTALEKSVYELAHINPEVISYVEAHGTGTSLGDPIEIAGLTDAFRAYTDHKQFCAIGSVKTNIGHTATASGIAGFIKVLLCLRNKHLVPSLNFEKPNQHIDFVNSPFYVNNEFKPWVHVDNTPLTAAISSFGFSGTNAHIVLEEGPETILSRAQHKPYYMVTLSAKHPISLKQRIEDLLEYLQHQSALPIEAIAYTLNVRRSHFNYRCAFVVSSLEELKGKLASFQQDKTSDGFYKGEVSNSIEDQPIYKQVLESTLQKLNILDINQTLKYKELLEALANFYIKGYEFDWQLLHQRESHQLLSLPAYPFLKERYWVDHSIGETISHCKLHPLLGSNISTLSEQCFKTVFTGNESFLKDHLVKGKKILPGVAFLEMARAAGELAMPGSQVKAIKDVVWASPIVVKEPGFEVNIRLEPQGKDVKYTIYSADELVHSQGMLIYDQEVICCAWSGIESLEKRLTQELSHEAFYDYCNEIGLEYGPSFRGLRWVKTNGSEALGYYSLPEDVSYLLPPQILDTVFQVSLVLDIGNTAINMPFALDAFTIQDGLPKEGYVHVKGDAQTLSLQVLNLQGEVCIELKNLCKRTMDGAAGKTDYYIPQWQLESLQGNHVIEDQLIWCIDLSESSMATALQAVYPNVHLQIIKPGMSNSTTVQHWQVDVHNETVWIDCFKKANTLPKGILFLASNQVDVETQIILLFRLFKALPKSTEVWLKVITPEADLPFEVPNSNALVGFAFSAVKEHQDCSLCCLNVPSFSHLSRDQMLSLAQVIMKELPVKDGSLVRWIYGFRAVLKLSPYFPVKITGSVFRTGGVYVIAGGAGGIGYALSEYLVKKYQAKLVWIGRRAPEEIQSKQAALGEVVYYQADIADYAQLQKAVGFAKEHYGVIHGVFDSAFVMKDSLIENMSEETMRCVLLPKVKGSINLYQAFAHESLDFFVFFSSIRSFMGAAGQSNYAAASTFQDAYALSLLNQAPFPVKVINWGYWGSVGRVADGYYRQRMKTQGFDSIEPQDGMQAIECILQQLTQQIVYLKGKPILPGRPCQSLDAVSSLPLVKPDIILPAIKMPTDFGAVHIAIRQLLVSYEQACVFQAGMDYTLDTILKALDVRPAYEPLVQEHLEFMCAEGLLRRENNRYKKIQTVKIERIPENSPYDRLLAQCMLNTLEVIQGKMLATEVLFPNGSLELVRPFYEMPETNLVNEKLAELTRAFVKEQNSGNATIHILEIGAGTGSTSRFVFEALKAYQKKICYWFTDISQKFTQAAEQKFGTDYPFVRFEVLNIESPPEKYLGEMDIVIATNVLHATADVPKTLLHTKMLLKPGGLLLLNEITEKEPFTTLTFGLMPGWWLAKDGYRTPGSPLLSEMQWKALLSLQGWRNIHTAKVQSAMGVAIILAQSDGIIDLPASHERTGEINRIVQPVQTKPFQLSLRKDKAVQASPKTTGIASEQVFDFVFKNVSEAFKKTLKLTEDRFNPEKSFEQYGVDSLISIEIINSINKILDIPLRPTALFNYSNVIELAKFIASNYQENIVKIIEKSGSGARSSVQADAKCRFANMNHDESRDDKMKEQSRSVHTNKDIAIIGMAGRFPGAKNLEEFWCNLAAGKDAITKIPSGRWDPNETDCPYGAFLDDIECFDSMFFDIAPSQAVLMDPQQRLFLEEAWHALEDAGYANQSISNTRCSVYVGAYGSDYQKLLQEQDRERIAQEFWSNGAALIASRISYFLNLKGGAVTVDTACSSSLVALHLGCQSLLMDESDMVIVGGSFTICTSEFHRLATGAGVLSKDGKCHTFDEAANGFVPGEGVAAIILKPLDKAIQDGDRIYAVVKGSNINQDGKTFGITAPSAAAQTELQKSVYEIAHVNPEVISYVEAHGTGTSLGDPIELAGLTDAFRAYTDKRQYCAIGSVKTNIGHTVTTAGIAGVIKILLCLKRKQLVPSLNFNQPNQYIDFANSPFYVNTEIKAWDRIAGAPLVAAISSFALSGTNAHVVIAEGPEPVFSNERHKPYYMVTLSAKHPESLKQRIEDLRLYLQQENAGSLEAIAYSLNARRSHFNHRCAVVVSSIEDLKEKLTWIQNDQNPEGWFKGKVAKTSEDKPIYKQVLEGTLEKLKVLDINQPIKHKELLETLANLYIKGFDIDWQSLHQGESHQILSLPTYPFLRERHWIPHADQHCPEQSDHLVFDNAEIVTSPELSYYQPVWEKSLIQNNGIPIRNVCVINDAALCEYLKSHYPDLKVIGYSPKEKTNQAFVREMKDNLSHIIIGSKKADVLKYVDHDLQQAVAFIKCLMQEKVSGPLRFVASYNQNDLAPEGMLTGFAKSLFQEHPDYQFTLVGLNHHSLEDKAKHLMNELAGTDFHVRYQQERQIERFVECSPTKNSAHVLRKGGVYLITGGLRGLGLIVANHLAKQYRAKLVLTGRSSINDKIKSQLAQIETLGASVLYLSGDVSDYTTVQKWIETAKDHFGDIHGVIHSAGIIEDRILFQKDWSIFKSVLMPKVAGVLNLDKATEKESLDCFVVFSSLAGCLGNVGQTDYASANAFLDSFIHWRELQHYKGLRKGKNISIDWPYWADGGMKIDDANERYLLEAYGLIKLPVEIGLKAFEEVLRIDAAQCLVCYGGKSHIAQSMKSTAFHIRQEATLRGNLNVADLEAEALKLLKIKMAAILQLPVDRLEADDSFEGYGLDSIIVMSLTRSLEEKFGNLPKTLFYEYQTLGELSHYFATHHANVLHSATARPASISARKSTLSPKAVPVSPSWNIRKPEEIPIAIIGLSGLYPMAANVDVLWENLKAGKDCVVEIPKERWDYTLYNDADNGRAKWGGFIEDHDKFDPLFFNISPREAEEMDPQERLFLQVAWQTLEDAGYTKEKFERNTGVFVGVTYGSYQLYSNEEANQILHSLPAAIANRVSYYLNLHGPSLALDTMCSSSLTAVHLACTSLRKGECKLAIAGGVNIASHPHKYLLLSQRSFLSSDGKCRSFGEGGDGYVPGEGVGAVLLKPLSDALKDNNRIYGVILGSSVNHGGFTHGFTVPSPNAQGALISEALKEAHIEPESISYIEAHGTGTKLGDPIEIRGLTQAFDKTQLQSCPIGSIKSNIGHLESAAGIAGLTKVLLQLKHKQLVPSIHSDDLNSYIEFGKTPFYVQRELTEWKSTPDHPRRAGISSFGAGGSNAHVIIEEGPEYVLSNVSHKPSYMVALSANHPDSLKQRIEDLSGYLRHHSTLPIEAIAYTLNVRRSHFNHRLAIVVNSVEELQQMLERAKQNQKGNGLFKGKVDQDPEDGAIYRKVLQTIMEELKAADYTELKAYRNNLEALANLYVKGYELDWELLHQGESNQFVALPTYSFLKERYWVSDVKRQNEMDKTTSRKVLLPSIPWLHPLLSVNTSTIYEQSFKTILTGAEFYLKDHVVAGQKVLPGVVYLEMARAAGELALPDKKVKGIERVVWLKPVVVEEPQELHISLEPDGEKVSYTIYSNIEEKVVHSQGVLLFEDSKVEAWEPIKSLLERLPHTQNLEAIYQRCEQQGLSYGKTFQAVQWIKSDGKEALGYYKGVLEGSYYLAPHLFDAVLHVGMALKQGEELTLPFALESLTIKNSLPAEGYVHVKGGGKTMSLQVLNMQGEVCVELSDLSVRSLEGLNLKTEDQEDSTSEASPTPISGVSNDYYLPTWQLEPLEASHDVVHQLVWCIDLSNSSLPEALKVEYPNVVFKNMNSETVWEDDPNGLPEGIVLIGSNQMEAETQVLLLFRLFKTLSKSSGVWLKIAIPEVDQAIQIPYSSALAGLGLSAVKEHPGCSLCCLNIPSFSELTLEQLPSLARAIMNEPPVKKGKVVRWTNGFRATLKLSPYFTPIIDKPVFRKGGVYVIAGGAGGIGYVLSEYLVKEYQAKLVWIGRRPREEIQSKQAALGSVVYYQADIADYTQLQTAITAAKEHYGVIHGVFHSAFVLNDGLIENISEKMLKEVLLPKVRGSINLFEAFAEDALDFFVFFSAMQSFVGAPGQSNYAAASTFQDAYALSVYPKALFPVKVINWSYWGSVGRVASDYYRQRMEALGVESIEPQDGIQAIEFILQQSAPQIAYLKGAPFLLGEYYKSLNNGLSLCVQI